MLTCSLAFSGGVKRAPASALVYGLLGHCLLRGYRLTRSIGQANCDLAAFVEGELDREQEGEKGR